MRKVVPYKTRRGLLRALDNGGRWYDVLSRAGDGNVTAAEVEHAAGGKDPGLFIALAGALLDETDRRRVTDVLPETLAERVRVFPPSFADPRRVEQARDVGGRYVVEGTLERVADKKVLDRQIHFTVTNGSDVATYRLGEPYAVYRLVADASGDGPLVLFPHKQAKSVPTTPIRLGGILKRFVHDHEQLMRFLDAHFYTPLDEAAESDEDEESESREGLRDSLRHRVR